MRFHIRWAGIRRFMPSARVQLALMSLSIVAATVAGAAGKRWY
jgi:hypothetical protein